MAKISIHFSRSWTSLWDTSAAADTEEEEKRRSRTRFLAFKNISFGYIINSWYGRRRKRRSRTRFLAFKKTTRPGCCSSEGSGFGFWSIPLEICECGRWLTTIWFPALLKDRRSSRARERSKLGTSVQQRWRRGIFGSSSFTWGIFWWIEKHESLVCSLYSTTKDLQMTKSAHSIEWHD